MPPPRAAIAAAALAAAVGVLLSGAPAPLAKGGKTDTAAPASFAAGEPLGLLDTRYWISNVRASSEEPGETAGRFAFAADNAFDDVVETFWMEGKVGAGVGESLQVTFNRPVRITGVGVAPAPAEYNRPTALLVELTDGKIHRATVGDALGARRATLPASTTRTVRVVVDEVLVGAKHDRTAVAEVLLYGAPLPYAEPPAETTARLRELIDSGAYHTAGEELGFFLGEGRIKRIEVAWWVATRGVDAFAVAGERPLEPVARLLHDLGDDGQRVLVRESERLLRDPGLGAGPWVMKVHAFWYLAALANECHRGVLDVGAAGTPGAGEAVGSAWHGCAGLLRNGDVRGLTVFARRLLDGGGVAGLASRAGVKGATKLRALRIIREAIRGRGTLAAFKKAFADLRKAAARRKADAALISDLAASAALRPLDTKK